MDKPGIAIWTPTAHIRVEWKNLLFNLGDVFLQSIYTSAGGDGVSAAISAAIDGLKSFKVDEPVESKAYGLIALSFAMAIDRLRPLDGTLLPSGIASEIGFAMQEAVETDTHVLQPDFFAEPTKFSLYLAARPMIVAALNKVRNGDKQEISAKLDSAFSSSVYRVVSLRSEYFSSLIEKLSSPGYEAALREYEWARYRAKLIENFEVVPLFGQNETKVSLSQLYISCKASFSLGDDVIIEKTEVDDLFILISKWLRSEDVSDTVRILSGGPGSGKSSFAKYLACEVARASHYRPIFVELQKLGNYADLQGAIFRRLVKEQEHFAADPLENKDASRPFLLIFDGLDELVIPGGEAATRTAESFASALHGLLRTLNGANVFRAKALVTGRTAIADAFRRSSSVHPNQAHLEILGFVKRGDYGFDLRPNWWSKYADAFLLTRELPEAFKTPRLESVTSEPLLCYLMAVSGYALEGWEDVADNHNKIFDKLLGEVWERKWGKKEGASGRVGPALALDKRSDFDALMETVALAAWWGGENRIATKEAFERSLTANGSISAWNKFKQDSGEAMGNLALTFYFKPSQNLAQGIEFTHKSFGEYLVARLLIRALNEKISKLLEVDSIEISEAADRWAKIATDALLTDDIRPFIENEVKMLDSAVLEVCSRQISRLLTKFVPTGLEVSKLFNGTIRDLSKRSDTGLLNLAICLQYLSSSSTMRFPSQWADISDPSDFLRSASLLYIGNRSLKPSFCRMNMEKLFMNGSFLIYFDFRGANLEGSNFVSSNVSYANFSGSTLSGSTFSSATVRGANFEFADLRGTSFDRAHIDDTIFDEDWFENVDPKTFEYPPYGSPVLRLKNGEYITKNDSRYPNLSEIYSSMNEGYSLKGFPHKTFYTFPALALEEDHPDDYAEEPGNEVPS